MLLLQGTLAGLASWCFDGRLVVFQEDALMAFDIVAATGNRHKIEEMRAILAPVGITVTGALEIGGMPAVDEDGATFAENAVRRRWQ